MCLRLSLKCFWVILSHLSLFLQFLKSPNTFSGHGQSWKHVSILFWAQELWFSVRHGGLCSKSSTESLLHYIDRTFKALHAQKMHLGTLETAKIGLNDSKWSRYTLVTILKPYLDFIFWTQESWFSVRRGGLSRNSPSGNHATLTDQPSEAPNLHKNHFWGSKIIKNVFNIPKMT